MSSRIDRRRVVCWAALPAIGLLGVVGCATPSSPEAERAALLARAREYWQLQLAGERLKAWNYEAASVDQSMTLEGYFKRGGITYDATEVVGIQSINGDDAVVNLHQRYSVPLIRVKNQVADGPDEWRRINGTWFHVLRKNSMFRKDKE